MLLKIEEFSLIGNSLGGALSIGLALRSSYESKKLIFMAPGGVEDKKFITQCREYRNFF